MFQTCELVAGWSLLGFSMCFFLVIPKVVTWGSGPHGGDSSGVRDQLVNVCSIQATDSAFAAIKTDGTCITWGNPQQLICTGHSFGFCSDNF